MGWIIWMVLGWDLQNSRDWLVVAIHQKSYHVGNILTDEHNSNILPRSKLFECIFNLFHCRLVIDEEVVGFLAQINIANPGHQEASDGVLVGDDGDEGGVVGGDVGPPRHGSQPRMLPSLRFLVLQRIRWSSTQSEIGSYSDGGHEQEGRGRRDPEDEEEQGGPHLRLLPVGCRQDQGNFQVGRAQHGAGHVGHQHNP